MEAAATIVGEEIATGVVAQIKHQFNYMYQYHVNIENLSSKVKILEDRKEDVQDKVNEASNNSQIIKDSVRNWLVKVEGKKAEAEGILKDKDKVGNGCWKGWCLNLKLRYRLSRKAVKKARDLDTFLAEGVFESVTHPQRPLGVVYEPMCSSEIKQAAEDDIKKTDQVFEIDKDEKSQDASDATQHVPEGIASSSAGTRGGLESRLSLLGDVMKAIKDDQIRIVRICGMGGIGKTTMAQEVEKMARAERLFQNIAMVEFYQEPDLKSIQLHIAESLGLKLKEENVKARAKRLHERLNDGGENKKILIILDNVWKIEDLEGTGIPLGDDQRCKILLTSRLDDVCKNIATEKEFKIEVLSDPEARILFQQSLGNYTPSHDQNQIAAELVKACAGLPIAIKTIARAVANKTEVMWRIALRKLQKSDLEGELAPLFKCLKVSYDFLGNEEIKKFFSLCCLFRKGFNVPIEALARYGMALRLFKDIDKLYEARDGAHGNVETLLNSNLFLKGDQKECIKVHDHIWDFALSISSNGKFMVNYGDGLEEWPRKDSYEDYTSISLLCSNMAELPKGLNCRNLKLLQLTGDDWYTHSLKFPESFYDGMGGLNVLAFMNLNVPLTQKLLQPLSNLRTLSLFKCSLRDDVCMIGNLDKLEVLSFAYSHIKELPTEIGKLTGLRLLDLNGCRELRAIAPGVFPYLISLEELYMRGTPLCCGDEVLAIFTDITSLSKLVVIDIEIPLEALPMDSLFKKLKKFNISINIDEGSEAEDSFPNSLDLTCDSSVLLQDGIKLLVQETERMYLRVTGMKTLLDNSKTWDFSNLKSLSLQSCNELIYLVNSVRKIEFCSLKYLSLDSLPNLVGFCKARDAVEFPQLVELELKNLPLFTSLHPETETSASEHSHTSSSHAFFNEKGLYKVCKFQNLRSLKVKSCGSLRHLSTPSTAISFGELEHLEVKKCKSLQEIIAAEGREEEKDCAMEEIIFPKLNHLVLSELPNLSNFMPKGYTFKWSSLKTMEVVNYGGESNIFANKNIIQGGTTGRKIALTSLEGMQIEGMDSTGLWRNHFPGGFSYALRSMSIFHCNTPLVLFFPYLVQGFRHLENLDLNECESLEVVFDLEELIVGGGEHKFAVFNKLNCIQICGLPRMTHVWKKVPKSFEGGFHNVTGLYIKNCYGLKYLFSPSIAKFLVKLKFATIRNCGVMEEVVSKRDEEGDVGQKDAVDIVLFPQLQVLKLDYLPSLMCFGPAEACAFDKLSLETHHEGNANTSISSSIFNKKDMEIRGSNSIEGFSYGLRSMIVYSCHKLLVLFPPHLIQGFNHLEKLDIRSCDNLEVVFDLEELNVKGEHKVVSILNQLYEMKLNDLPSMSHVWKKVPKDFKGGFHNLTSLEVDECGSLRYLFSPLIAKCLVKLRELSIEDCEVMEEVVSKRDEEGEEDKSNAIDMILFPELVQLKLRDLPSLICLGPAGAYNFDKLSCGAPNVGSDVTHDQGNSNSSIPTPIFNGKLSFSGPQSSSPASSALLGLGRCQLPAWSLDNLTSVKMYKCRKLLSLFPPHIAVRLPVLQHLSIEECDSLRYLLSSFTVTSLVQLKDLEIIDCEMMEVIVKDEENEEAVDKMSKLVFPRLTSLTIKELPNLRGIYLGKLAFEWPSLGSVEINFCWKMGIFTCGYSSTPILDRVFMDSIPHSLEERDLNKTLTSVQQMAHDKLALKEEGILTCKGFHLAGEHLIAQCPSWSWQSGETHMANDDLPSKRQFLTTRNVPCLRRARARASSSTVVAIEDKNEADNECADESNISRPRTYDVSITYDKDNRTPRLWLTGYEESNIWILPLPLELVLQDIAKVHPNELVTIERHPHMYDYQVSLYPCLLPSVIKDFSNQLTMQGLQPELQHYLQLLLEFYAPHIPTIQYSFR